jgi:ankyrin repeat protein
MTTGLTIEDQLRTARKHGKLEAVNALLVSMVDEGDPIDPSFLHVATEEGHADIVEALLSSGSVDGSRSGEVDSTALHSAAMLEHVEVAQMLLKRGADVSAEYDSLTPLHWASMSGNWEVVKLLVEHGASVNSKSGNGTTPLHMAANIGNSEIASLLFSKGAKVDEEDDL